MHQINMMCWKNNCQRGRSNCASAGLTDLSGDPELQGDPRGPAGEDRRARGRAPVGGCWTNEGLWGLCNSKLYELINNNGYKE